MSSSPNAESIPRTSASFPSGIIYTTDKSDLSPLCLTGLSRTSTTFTFSSPGSLGITTIARALSTFYLGIHRGLAGALVFDSNENKNLAKDELAVMIKDLPASLKFPDVKGFNRDALTLKNDSKILFKSAGVKKTKTSGTLGRSAGLTLITRI